MRPLRSFAALAAVALVTLGCSRAEPSPAPTPAPAESARTKPASDRGTRARGEREGRSPSYASAGSAGPSAPLVLARGIRFVRAGSGEDVPKLVRAEREKAAADGRDLVVYVGAKWCEPCQRFHAAAQRGELDAEFPELTILEFDLDEDRERIFAAGYSSKLIPLFVFPGEDGRGSDRRFEGGVKGERAVANLAPRLRKLLAK